MPARARLTLMAAATAVIAGALAVVLLTGGPSSGRQSGKRFEGSLRPQIPPKDFTLRDEQGRRVSLAEHRGEVVILTFVYTTCADTCPVLASQIGGALDDLGDDDVPALAVSVDPANDTPGRARRFLVRHRLSGGRMHVLLGSRSELAPVWKDYGIGPQGPDFDHSASVILIDRQGRQRVSFPVDQLTPERLAHDVRLLQAERPPTT